MKRRAGAGDGKPAMGAHRSSVCLFINIQNYRDIHIGMDLHQLQWEFIVQKCH